ncbi:Gfo/Idh/MocA family protein [Engelhardtia mirabilis]|uniref:1,5-anhydro-D-fructose reductase n=1 Tax=Engelhardtia mirabilis TaxID=2528011 RepID=A0A518BIS6_9BACT|nr:1,5-anhydro-D-fructose reductase [Planctomycetes bacterium Pla133]QDV01208.1 1,5-anhydro-D-fructose reductase [Planctomycetes bacterium Pla86]
MAPLNLGIVGPGQVARVFAAAAIESGAARITRVLGRGRERLEDFTAEFGGRAFDDRLAFFMDEDPAAPMEAVYIATPHTEHLQPARLALECGIHVLCEKPLVLPLGKCSGLIRHARRTRVALMEGWMYRTHPQVAALFELISAGELGTIRRVESEFAFDCPFDPQHRLFKFALGGGAILDVGGYPLSLALGVARAEAGGGSDILQSAALVAAEGELTPSMVIGDARATVRIGEIEAHLRAAITRDGGCSARVVGSRATATLEHPFMPEGRRRGLVGAILIDREGHVERREVPSPLDCFALEALAFRDLVRSGQWLGPTWPLVDHDESSVIARLMIDWRQAIYETLPQDFQLPEGLTLSDLELDVPDLPEFL